MPGSMIVSEQSRRATLALLPQGAFETTPDGAWDFVSPALQYMFGDLPASSLLGREWLSRVHPDDFQRVLAEYRQAREFDRPWRQNFRMVRADGSHLHVGVDANPLPQEPGVRGVRYVGLVRDRGNIVRAEAQAAETSELMRALSEVVREGVLINRVDVTVAANPAAARILGYDSPDELMGMTGEQRLHPDDLPAMMGFAASQRETLGVIRLRHRNGSFVECALLGRPVHFAGAPARLVTFVPLEDPLLAAAFRGPQQP